MVSPLAPWPSVLAAIVGAVNVARAVPIASAAIIGRVLLNTVTSSVNGAGCQSACAKCVSAKRERAQKGHSAVLL